MRRSAAAVGRGALCVKAFVAQPESGASGRYRVYQWQEPLRALGIALDVVPFFDDRAVSRLYAPGRVVQKSWDLTRCTLRRFAQLRTAGRCDLALIHRELSPLAGRWPLALLRDRQPRWVYDLDDAVFLPNVSHANRRFVGLKSHGDAAAIAVGARRVAAGNAWLAEWARNERKGRPHDEVEVIPTVVDSDQWVPRQPGDDGRIRLVWTGSPSTRQYLAAWLPVLVRLAARHDNLELHVIGANLHASGIQCVVHPWSASTEQSIVSRCHIGLAPLGRGEWERGKCGLKLLLYMALGLPAVADRAGVQPEIVTSGEDGLLVDGAVELEAALDRLVKDVALRRSLGRAARATLERRYSVHAVAPRLAALLRRAAESP